MDNITNYSSWTIRLVHILLLLIIPLIAFEIAGYLAFSNWWILEDTTYLHYFFVMQAMWMFAIVFNKEVKIFSETGGIGKNLYHSHFTFFYFTFLVLLYIFTFKKFEHGRFFSTYTFITIYVLTITIKISVWQFYKYLRKRGYFTINAIIIGTPKLSNNLQQYFLDNADLGIKIIGKYNIDEMDIVESHICKFENNISYLFICKDLSHSEINKWINLCDDHLIKLRAIANTSILSFITNPIIFNYNYLPMVALNYTPLDNVNNQLKKRIFDLVFSSFVLIFILSWLIPIVAILIKLSSKGPVFFRQKRKGRNNRDFRVYKFRTMRINAVADTLLATKEDPRITKIGCILRKTSIDELPQFINVFLGDMSIVGPRPFMTGVNEEFSNKINKFMTRHFVKPGITGMASLKFRSGESQRIYVGKIRLDRFYIYNWSLALDIKIILDTIYSILFKRDAY